MIDFLWSFQRWSRQLTLASIFNEKLLTPTVFSAETLVSIAFSIADICLEWRWL